jgi:hypothetical protein
MAEVTILMGGSNYDECAVLAVFRQESMADEAIRSISEWHKNKPDLPRVDAPDSERDFYSAYKDTFPFESDYDFDIYYKVKHELR